MSARGATREAIVRAATGIFRRRGVTGAGIGDVCARAGVTKGVFSHHFPGGKEELVREVVQRNGADVLAATEAAGDVAAAFSGYAALLRARGTDFGCPVAAAVVDVSASSPAVRRDAGEALASWAAAFGADGELVVAALEGAILLARATDDPEVVARVGRALTALRANVPT
ncbi:MAG TPA: TetR/AcrR family transcriptional regulator [Iamia sp.]|nr:TetR/AcrR family transcriptional regulator [Iamia sp.]